MDPVLSSTVESSSLDPIRVLFEQLMAGLARVEARMDDYVRQSSRHMLRLDPEPLHSRTQSRPLEVPLPFTQPFAAVSVTPPPPASATFLGRPEGFHPNPSCASGPFRAGFTTPTTVPCLSHTEGFLPNPNSAAGSLRPGPAAISVGIAGHVAATVLVVRSAAHVWITADRAMGSASLFKSSCRLGSLGQPLHRTPRVGVAASHHSATA